MLFALRVRGFSTTNTIQYAVQRVEKNTPEWHEKLFKTLNRSQPLLIPTEACH